MTEAEYQIFKTTRERLRAAIFTVPEPQRWALAEAVAAYTKATGDAAQEIVSFASRSRHMAPIDA